MGSRFGVIAIRDFGDSMTGEVVRVVSKTGPSVKESFIWWNESLKSIDDYLIGRPESAEVVDIFQVRDVPSWDPALVYVRDIPGSDDIAFSLDGYFGGNRANSSEATKVRDLNDVPSLDEDEFWQWIAELRGRSSVSTNECLLRFLETQDLSELASFERRKRELLSALASEETASLQPDRLVFGSDSFGWWCLGVIARGRETYLEALAGSKIELDELEWECAQELDDIAANAHEARTGDRPVFIGPTAGRTKKSRRVNGAIDNSDDSESTGADRVDIERDFRPRTYEAMTQRGLNPFLVGSRFVVRRPENCVECVAIQHIDPELEDVGYQLLVAAREFAERLGGKVASPMEYYDTMTHRVFDLLVVFEIRRRWTGELSEYFARYGLQPQSSLK